jgi:hypothetical protein
VCHPRFLSLRRSACWPCAHPGRASDMVCGRVRPEGGTCRAARLSSRRHGRHPIINTPGPRSKGAAALKPPENVTPERSPCGRRRRSLPARLAPR